MVNIENTLSLVLRTGVLLAGTLMLLGFFTIPSLLWAGIVVLALTPFLRVIIAGIAFLTKKEWIFFIIALYVIIVLVIGIFV